eukprot:756002-Hanusia_phi.AAC.2
MSTGYRASGRNVNWQDSMGCGRRADRCTGEEQVDQRWSGTSLCLREYAIRCAMVVSSPRTGVVLPDTSNSIERVIRGICYLELAVSVMLGILARTDALPAILPQKFEFSPHLRVSLFILEEGGRKMKQGTCVTGLWTGESNDGLRIIGGTKAGTSYPWLVEFLPNSTTLW